jgi:outer membrane protein TolC
LGFTFAVPLGVRAERAQVSNLELRVAKARTALAAQELEISHELANAFNLLERWHTNAGTSLERQGAASDRVNATTAEYESGRIPVDALLRARVSQAQAKIEYERSIVEYNKSIANLAFRTGTLYEHYSIRLAEAGALPELASERPEPPLAGPPAERQHPTKHGGGWIEPAES